MTDKERIKQLKEKAKADAKALSIAQMDFQTIAWFVDEHNFGLARNRAHDALERINEHLGKLDR